MRKKGGSVSVKVNPLHVKKVVPKTVTLTLSKEDMQLVFDCVWRFWEMQEFVSPKITQKLQRIKEKIWDQGCAL